MTFLLALDQGTSSSRSMVFDTQGRIVSQAQQPLPQHFAQPGWVEHDPMQIWQTQLHTAQMALQKAGISAQDIKGVGITNQRETTLLWHRSTGQPLHHAIVWQDRRTEPICAALREQGYEADITRRTGLRLDAYFSATKLQWLLDHIPSAREQAQRGELAFGTVDTWLLWQFTRGQVHATDVSNASRTLLFNIHTQTWDEDLLDRLRIPRSVLPKVLPSCADFGVMHPDWLGHAVPITAMAGDQQSALFGQNCHQPGTAKNTYGTGCFALMHTGAHAHASAHGLLTSCAAQVDHQPAYALEGSVFVGGAVVQWLRDGLHAIDSSSAIEALACSVPDSGGVLFVPAFTGLGAPYWKPDARGSITGLTRGSTVAHIARAALESIAYQSTALLTAMSADITATGCPPLQELRVDGGACANDMLMQFQADLLGMRVIRPAVIETTALGAAYLAGLQAGVFSSIEALSHLWQAQKIFEPHMSRTTAAEHMARWEQAVRQTITT